MNRYPTSSFAAIALGASFCAAALLALPAPAAAACAQVEVQNVRPEQGNLMVAAYADAQAFNKAPLASLKLPAGAGTTMTVPVCELPGSPSLSITLYQDLNGNGKLDRNILGIPSEPWGASGKPAAMSAPTWETTAVPLDGATIVVKLSQ